MGLGSVRVRFGLVSIRVRWVRFEFLALLVFLQLLVIAQLRH